MQTRTQRRSQKMNASGQPLRLILAAAVVGFLLLLGAVFILPRNEAAPTPSTSAASQNLPPFVSVQEAYALYQQPDVFFLDVREPFEWDAIHIPNTTLIPLGQLARRVNEVPRDKKIVVVCRSGNRSQEGRDILKRAGFSDVTSMNGGVNAWRALGFPTVP